MITPFELLVQLLVVVMLLELVVELEAVVVVAFQLLAILLLQMCAPRPLVEPTKSKSSHTPIDKEELPRPEIRSWRTTKS